MVVFIQFSLVVFTPFCDFFRYGVAAVLSVTAASNHRTVDGVPARQFRRPVHRCFPLRRHVQCPALADLRRGLLAIASPFVMAFDYCFLAMEIEQLPRSSLHVCALPAFLLKRRWSAAQREWQQNRPETRDDATTGTVREPGENQRGVTKRRTASASGPRMPFGRATPGLAQWKRRNRARRAASGGMFLQERFSGLQRHIESPGHDLATKPTVELILQRIHPGDISRVRETLDRASQGGTDSDFEHRFLMHDGFARACPLFWPRRDEG